MPAYWTQFEELYDRDGWVNAPVMKTGEVAKRNDQVKEGIDALLKQYGYLRNGRYYVTRTDICPSVLMEYGFMINPAEFSTLYSNTNIYKAAYGTAQAVINTIQ